MVTIIQGNSVFEDDAVWGFEHEESGCFIHNPYLSPCGRDEVEPISYYGLSLLELDKLNQLNGNSL